MLLKGRFLISSFLKNIRMTKNISLFRKSAITRSILFLILSLFYFTEAYADYYRVTSSGALNIRASANGSSEVIGQLRQGDVVDVDGTENGWARLRYNGRDGYVSTSYLTAAEENGEAGASSDKASRSFFSRLFDNDGEAGWFTVVKWIFIIGIGIFLVRVALLVIARVVVFGLVIGAFALAGGFLIKLFGWIETDTMWTVAQWGFYVGNVLGLLDSFIHFRDVLNDASDTESGSSSSSGGDGLKRYSVMVDGREYILTQDSKYSECNYTDQDGNPWYCGSSGFRPL